MSKTVEELFREIILLNELDGNLAAALRFSDPDGKLSGKSGWSYGVCQFDTQNNTAAIACLRECGFTEAEIKGIVDQTIDVKPLAQRLIDHAGIIARYDADQLSYCIKKAEKFAGDWNVPVADTKALLALADTVNQYGSLGSGSAKYLLALKRPVKALDVLNMKLTWKYAKASKHNCDDTVRRHNNIAKVCGS